MRTPGVLRETDLELLRTLRIISVESPGKCKGKYKEDEKTESLSLVSRMQYSKEETVILYIFIPYNRYQRGGM